MIEKGWFDQQMIDKNVINNWPTNNQQIIDKKVIAESMAIAKLLAEDCGLAGKAWIHIQLNINPIESIVVLQGPTIL